MTKKSICLTTCIICALSVLLAGSAALAQSGNYIVFSAMYSASSDSNFSVGDVTGEFGIKGGGGFLLAFGNRFDSGFSLETEVSNRGSKVESLTLGRPEQNGTVPDTTFFPVPGGDVVSTVASEGVETTAVAEGADNTISMADISLTDTTVTAQFTPIKITTTALMVNGVFRMDDVGFLRPYFGAGVGISIVKTDDASIDFAYQFLGGLDIPLSEAMSIRVGYRYFATKTIDLGYGEAKTSSHNLELGAVVSF